MHRSALGELDRQYSPRFVYFERFANELVQYAATADRDLTSLKVDPPTAEGVSLGLLGRRFLIHPELTTREGLTGATFSIVCVLLGRNVREVDMITGQLEIDRYGEFKFIDHDGIGSSESLNGNAIQVLDLLIPRQTFQKIA